MADVSILNADCLDALPTLADCSVDAIVTDPPYELKFMGKKWDGSGIAFNPAVWAECLRVLKPGGHLLAFGGSRTWHRLAVAIEDAGFELRDSIAWLYGSGFPKSLDVSKAIDKAAGADGEVVGMKRSGDVRGLVSGPNPEAAKHKPITAPATDLARQWQGWGTALKPAFEPIVVARKPLVGTVAANVVAHGTGALNIDACRVAANGRPLKKSASEVSTGIFGDGLNGSKSDGVTNLGRWPTNVVLDESQAAVLDEQSGTTRSPKTVNSDTRQQSVDTSVNFGAGSRTVENSYGDSGGASRFFPTFQYQAKAPTKERPNVDGVAHPTVKPLALMRWLVRLVTPPGGIVLDPFAGSGTTAEACLLEGFGCVAIERDAEYVPLIEQRLARNAAEAA